MLIILISIGVFFCGCLCSAFFGALAGIFPCMVGFGGFCFGVGRLLWKGIVRFWRWGTGRSQMGAVEEAYEEVLPEDEDQAEEERIDLEEVARIAEIAVLKRILAMMDEADNREQEESSAVEKFPNDNAVIEDENEEDEKDQVYVGSEEWFCQKRKEIPKEDDEEEIQFLKEKVLRLRVYLDRLYQKKEEEEILGTKESSKTWRRLMLHIQKAEEEYKNEKELLRRCVRGY